MVDETQGVSPWDRVLARVYDPDKKPKAWDKTKNSFRVPAIKYFHCGCCIFLVPKAEEWVLNEFGMESV
jgi:hypothetical protein